MNNLSTQSFNSLRRIWLEEFLNRADVAQVLYGAMSRKITGTVKISVHPEDESGIQSVVAKELVGDLSYDKTAEQTIGPVVTWSAPFEGAVSVELYTLPNGFGMLTASFTWAASLAQKILLCNILLEAGVTEAFVNFDQRPGESPVQTNEQGMVSLKELKAKFERIFGTETPVSEKRQQNVGEMLEELFG